jgi:hypothetical protein
VPSNRRTRTDDLRVPRVGTDGNGHVSVPWAPGIGTAGTVYLGLYAATGTATSGTVYLVGASANIGADSAGNPYGVLYGALLMATDAGTDHVDMATCTAFAANNQSVTTPPPER